MYLSSGALAQIEFLLQFPLLTYSKEQHQSYHLIGQNSTGARLLDCAWYMHGMEVDVSHLSLAI